MHETDAFHPLLRRQLLSAQDEDGARDISVLLGLVSKAYQDQDRMRSRLERAMALMNVELRKNVDERDRLVLSLQRRTEQFEATLSNMRQGLAMFSNDALVVANDWLAETLGYPNLEALEGATLGQVLKDAPSLMKVEQNDAARTTLVHVGKYENNPKDVIVTQFEATEGRTFELALVFGQQNTRILTLDDVTESKFAEAQLNYMAKHDALTGLPNRNYLAEIIAAAEKEARQGHLCAIHCLDLDQFKSVNDTLGHDVGDALLQAVSQRLQSCVKDSDIVARLGGDEFAVVQRRLLSLKEAGKLAERFIETLSKPFQIGSHRLQIGVSVGIALLSGDLSSSEKPFKQADIALYRAKSDGRGCYRVFQPKMDIYLQERRALEVDLRNANFDQEFELHFQPQFEMASMSIIGLEALLRWNHRSRGMLMPGKFISLSEEIGLIEDIGDWTLRQACKEAAKWDNPNVVIAVNLSAVQFGRTRLISSVRDALLEAQIRPEQLELEITEGVLLENSKPTLDQLNQLRDLGVKIAMDDFGSGYSSLNYLQKFSFDKIKFDKMFLTEQPYEESNVAILRAITGLCKDLGIDTVIEGVEDECQLQKLEAEGIGFTAIQGFLYGRPQPAKSIRSLLVNQGATFAGSQRRNRVMSRLS